MKIIRAIYDKRLYQKSITENFSKPFKHWIIVSLLAILAAIVYGGYQIYTLTPSFQELKNSIPYFEINDGMLSIDERVEFIGEDSVLIVDDEYLFDENDFRYSPSYIVATRDAVYSRGEDGAHHYYYADIELLKNTNRDMLAESINKLIPAEMVLSFIIFAVIGILFFIVVYLSITFVPILFLALVGLLTAKIFSKPLTFKESLKIMFYGSTLPIIVGTSYWLITQFSIDPLLMFALAVIYTGYFISQLQPEIDSALVQMPIQ